MLFLPGGTKRRQPRRQQRSLPLPPSSTAAVSPACLLQLAFAITISILSSTTLTGTTDGCYLDLSGGTCE